MSSSKVLALGKDISPVLQEDMVADPYDPQTWEVDFLETRRFLRGRRFGISAKAMRVRFPVRMLRYWFTYHLLAAEYERVGRPLKILEIGTHNGQMRTFARL